MIKFFTPLRTVLLVAVVVVLLVGFAIVPAGTTLPVHWNLAGEPDVFLPREAALLLPAGIVALVWAIFIGVDRFARPADRQAGAYVTGVALTALTATFLAVLVAIVLIGAGLEVDMIRVVAVAIGALLVVFGNAMPKSRPNSYAGIRMPTTLRSETNWLATHRFGGRLMVAGGAVLLVAAFAAPHEVLVWWVAGCVVLPVLAAATYSLAIARHPA